MGIKGIGGEIMAIFNLRVSPSKDKSADFKFKYIQRIDNFSWDKQEKYDDFLYGENVNMPLFAKENPLIFWEEAEINERINANVFREIEFSLPNELTQEENIELAREFASKLLGDKYVYSLAVHSKPSTNSEENIHCHIMFSERELDEIERKTPEHFFKRRDSKNPANGGCLKRDWSRLSKLYEIRQTWENLANKKLKTKGIQISAKSLKAQRIEALLNEDFLKAELLDRTPINYDSKFLKYSTNEELKDEVMKFYNYSKKIKELKEKEFKFKKQNYKQENELARERYYLSEGIEYNPSNFDIQEKITHFNLENMFMTSVDNKILLDLKKNRVKEIGYASKEETIKLKALDTLTKGKYSISLKRLNSLNEIYNQLANKEMFKFKEEKKEIEDYLNSITKNEYFSKKLEKMKENILEKYNLEKIELHKEIEVLENNDYKDICLQFNSKNYEVSSYLLQEAYNKLKILKQEKIDIDKKVLDHKQLLTKDLRKEIYKEFKSDVLEKYEELLLWKKEILNIENIELRNELNQKISKREIGFKNYDLENNINEIVEKQTSELKGKYKELRQAQDSTNGKIKYTELFLAELRGMKEIKAIDSKFKLEQEYERIKESGNTYEKIKFNVKIEKLENNFNRIFDKNSQLQKFDFLEPNKEERSNYILKLKEEIQEYKEKNIEIMYYLSKNKITDESIKIKILDRYTQNKYSEELNKIKYYENEIKNKKSIEENKVMLSLSKNKVKDIENNFKISEDEIQIEKTHFRSKQIEVFAEIRENKEKIQNCYATIKSLSKPKIKGMRLINSLQNFGRQSDDNKAKKLKVMRSGKILIKDDDEEKLRRREWENSIY